MMATDEIFPEPISKAGPPPLRPSIGTTGDAPVRKLSLRQIMISLIYFAILFWAVKQVVATEQLLQVILVGVILGVGVAGVGLFVVRTSRRFAAVGWGIFDLGYFIIALVTTTFVAIPSTMVLVGCQLYLGRRRRAIDQEALLWVLTVAAESGMPLSPGVQALSSQMTGAFAVWTESLARLLQEGKSLPEALGEIPRLVPREILLLIQVGSESGMLASGLRDAVDTSARRRPVLQQVLGKLAYLGWVMAIGLSIVGFVLYFIMPKFEAIFRDFGLSLPASTVFVVKSSHLMVRYAWLFGLVGLIGLVYLMVALFGSVNLGIPIFDRLFARRHSIRLMQALAVAVRAGRPIPLALGSLARWYPTAWVRRKLSRAEQDASQGIHWITALSENGLVSSTDVSVLASSERAGNLAWALTELAQTGERRLGYRLLAWSQSLFVGAMLVLGSLTFLIALAYFLPLTELISRLAS